MPPKGAGRAITGTRAISTALEAMDPSQNITNEDERSRDGHNNTVVAENQTPTVGQGEDQDLDRQLVEEEQQTERARKRARIQSLRAERARLEAGGSSTPTSTTIEAPTRPGPIPNMGYTVQLPKPEPPHRFTGRNRADWDHWVRDVERFLIGAPNSFPTEHSKVVFGAQYLGITQRDRWDRSEAALGLEEVTWEALKENMLDSMGNAEERAEKAYERIKSAQQGRYTPTELLQYLKSLWADADVRDEPAQMRDFKAALAPNIKSRVNLGAKRYDTLVGLEEAANEAHRWLKRYNPDGSERRERRLSPVRTPKHVIVKAESAVVRGDRPTLNARGSWRRDQGNSQRPQAGQKRDITCYGCGKPGHKRPDCPNKEKEQGKVNPTKR